MGASWEASEQQWAAITAPLAPAVVIAGAGSGKTTLMAARVVYLVLTGQVRPDQVLGLTFTTKAASELRAQIRAGADRQGRWTSPHPTTRTSGARARLRPTTPTPPACSPTTGCGSGTSRTPGSSPTRRATSSVRGWWTGTPAWSRT